MARIRSVKPEYWLDRKLARGASRDARLLYIGLWNYADEHGRLHGDPAVIKGQVFPYDDVSIDGLLDELELLGRVQRYTFDGDPYLYLPKLAKHQRLEPNKSVSRLPEPPEWPDPPKSGAHSEKAAAESETIAAESETNVAQQVAGSRLQGAGGKGQVASGSSHAAAAEFSELQEALSVAGITVAWDAGGDGLTIIAEALERCGVHALVKHATSRHQRDNPAFSVRAFVPGWGTLPAPKRKLEAVGDPCPHGAAHWTRCSSCKAAAEAS